MPLALDADPWIGNSGSSRATGRGGKTGLFELRSRRLEGVPECPCSSSPPDLGRRRGVRFLEGPDESLALFAERSSRLLETARSLEAVRPPGPKPLRAKLVTARLAERTTALNDGA